jgi:hypothetical protein
MDRESFELEKEAVEWLMKNNIKFEEAISIVSYAQNIDKPLCVSFLRMMVEDLQEEKKKNDG